MPIVIEPAAGHVDPTALRERLPDADVREPARKDVAATIADADEPVVFLCSNTAWRRRYLVALSADDWVLTTTAGYDGYPVAAFAERGIELTNSPGISAETVAEHALGMAISFTRRFPHYRECQREREWSRRRDDLFDLVETTVCLVGLGNVGEAIARRLTACGATVRGVKRDPTDYDGVADAVYPTADLRAAISDARLLVLAVPLTDETRGLIGADELASLADDGVVVNVARGPVLDTEALVAALDDGWLRGAALDVFDEEPLSADSPLWDREDALLTPHCAGTTDRYGERALEIVVDQYRRWKRDDPRTHRVV